MQSNETALVYTLPTCTYCDPVKIFLEKHGVAYEEKNVMKTPNRQVLQELGYKTVPITIFGNGKVVVGFNEDELLDAMK